MGFNSMFSGLAEEGENSDRIFTRNGVKTKFMSGKQPITFSILPAVDPSNPDKRVSYLPSILPGNPPTLSDWGNGAYVYRKLGRGDWKERYDIVSLSSVGEECPIDVVRKVAKSDPTWQYLVDDGKFGDPNRVPAVLPAKRQFLFCNVFLPNEAERVAHVGIFSKSVANKLVGENGLVFQPSPSATEEQVQANYLAAFANGDITAPQGAPVFVVEKGHDKGEMSQYELKFALDANRRVMRVPATQDIMATRYDIQDLRSYLNILSADQIVQILIREMTGRSPAGYHEYALLKLALGGKYQIPEPPSAPAATSTIQSGFVAGVDGGVPAGAAPVAAPVPTGTPVPAVPVPAPSAAPVAPTAAPAPVPVTPTAAPAVPPAATVSVAVPPAAPAHTVALGNEAGAAFHAAVAAGAAQPVAPAPGVVPGDPVPAFDKQAFLARLAKGGNQ